MRVAFLGDIFSNEPCSNVQIDKELLGILNSCDFVIANLEGPILDPFQNIQPWKKAGPTLSQHHDVLDLMKKLKVSHTCLANNHIYDYGKDGLLSTIRYLEQVGIIPFGAGTQTTAYKPIIISNEMDRLAIISGGEAQFGALVDYYDDECGYSWFFSEKIKSNVKKLKHDNIPTVLFSHQGLEMARHPLPEWRYHNNLLHEIGLKTIINTHPHVVQGKSSVGGDTTYHSIGNFFFNKNLALQEVSWKNGLIVIVNISAAQLALEEVFTSFTDKKIRIDPGGKEQFEELTLELRDERSYVNWVNSYLLQVWREYYLSYYSNSIIREDIFAKSKIIGKLLLYLKKRFFVNLDTTLLQHNLQIETHRFAVERILRLINRTY